VSGTSASTPLIGGLVALLLEEHPTWGPFEVVEALRSTADQASTPDNHRGFGLARGALAVEWIPSTVDTQPGAGPGQLSGLGPNPARGDQVSLRLRMGEGAGRAVVTLYDARGRLVRTLLDEDLPAGAARALRWDGNAGDGRRARAGIYWARFQAPGVHDSYRFVYVP
jgi:subtilisin family serine protease